MNDEVGVVYSIWEQLWYGTSEPLDDLLQRVSKSENIDVLHLGEVSHGLVVPATFFSPLYFREGVDFAVSGNLEREVEDLLQVDTPAVISWTNLNSDRRRSLYNLDRLTESRKVIVYVGKVRQGVLDDAQSTFNHLAYMASRVYAIILDMGKTTGNLNFDTAALDIASSVASKLPDYALIGIRRDNSDAVSLHYAVEYRL